MTIEKLPSGSYRITQMQNGKRYRITVDYKPTKIEALKLISKQMEGCCVKGSFQAAAFNYIESKKNILSPRTVKEYNLYANALPQWFLDMPMNQIDQMAVQKLVNELAVRLAPKTVRNYHGFVASVLTPYITLRTTLPRVEIQEIYIPPKEDYKALLEAFEGTQYHVVYQLMRWGMRRGEILALTPEDIEGDIVHITKDMVLSPEKEWVIKPPKTRKSRRDIVIPMKLADEIRAQGYVYKGHPNNIERTFKRTQRQLGIQEFNPHALRHLSASIMLEMGYDMKSIQDWHGWCTPNTPNKIYLQSILLKNRDAVRKMVDDLENYFE